MTPVSAQSATEILAPIRHVFAHAADFERMPAWQPDLHVVDVLGRDSAGRPHRVYTELETPLRRAKVTLEITYTDPQVIAWKMVDGNVPGFEGSWKLAPLSATLTRVEYEVIIDFGRLGRLVRGPAADLLREQTVSTMPGRLKAYVESRGSDLPSGPDRPA